MKPVLRKQRLEIPIEYIAGYDLMENTYLTAEPETHQWIADNVRPNWTVMDIGAHIGSYTLLLSILTPGGKVYAFEPCSQTRDMLLDNMGHNNIRFGYDFRNIKIVPMAVGNITGSNIQETLWFTDGTDVYGKTDGKFKFTTLDSYINKNKHFSRLDFIKCDADGWDYEILLGAKESLNKFRPFLIFECNYALEWRGHTADDIEKFLAEINYQHKVIDPSPSNWLCWPIEKNPGG